MKSIFDFDTNMRASDSTQPRTVQTRDAKDATAFALFGSGALHESGYARLTAAERDRLRPINDGAAWLAEHASGIQLRFATDSTQIVLHARLRSKFDMTNMTQISQCGADLYVFDEQRNMFMLLDVARFRFDASEYELQLCRFAPEQKAMRKYLLYLPLYMAVDEMSIGLDEGAAVKPYGFDNAAKIAVYGTSIVQGASASRPGLAPTNVLSRALDCETFNFGFSGCAFMEPEMGDMLGARPPFDCLIVDTDPNAGIDARLEQNAAKFFDAFFAHRPQTPVALYSRILFSLDLYDDYRVKLRDYYRGFLKDLAATYRRKGYDMRFIDGSKLLKGNFTEYSTDGIHPNDAGMRVLANSYIAAVKRMLAR